METFRRYLLAALHGVDGALIARSTIDQLARAAEQLPAAFSQFLFGFECRLDDPEPLADFVVAASPRQNGKRVFVQDLFQSPPLARYAETDPAWARVRALVQACLANDPALCPWLENISLEFDYAALGMPPIPGVFLGFLHRSDDLSGLYPAEINARGMDAVRRGLTLLRGDPLPTATHAQIQRCFDTLPRFAVIFQTGMMLSRASAAARLVVTRVTADEIALYLEQVGWEGNVQHVRASLRAELEFFERTDLALDVGERVLPRVGVEYRFVERGQPPHEARWNLALNALVADGFCVPAKAQALLHFPGREQFFGAQLPPIELVRGLHHLKLVYEGDRIVAAKAYLWAGVRRDQSAAMDS